MNKNTIHEINNLNAAVTIFSKELKETLTIKAVKGKRGWNTLPAKQLCEGLRELMQVYNNPDLKPEEAKDLLVHIAAFSMFVHKAISEGR